MAVVSNPKTGEILAISGQQYNRVIEEGSSRFTDVSHQAVYNSYTPGSSVKGATILTGLHEGAIQPGQTFFDKPMYLAGERKASLSQNNGTVSDITALQKSSNVYMFFLARRLGGDYGMDYRIPGLSLKEGTFDKFVYNFNQFGLGVETGIDFPYESVGVKGEITQPGRFSTSPSGSSAVIRRCSSISMYPRSRTAVTGFSRIL